MARLPGDGPSLCLTGHLDTVPLGRADWSVDPFSGETDGDRLFGRGTSDMKGGTAAIVVAAERLARAGGSRARARAVRWRGDRLRGRAGAGPRGGRARRVRRGAGGRADHELPVRRAQGRRVGGRGGAREDRARLDAAPGRERHLSARAGHPLAAGPRPSTPSTRCSAPRRSRSARSRAASTSTRCPDRAEAGIDVRTVPGLSSDAVLDALRERLGDGVELSPRVALDPIDTDPSGDWVQTVFSVMEPLIGETPEPRGLAYFTDAAALSPGVREPADDHLRPGRRRAGAPHRRVVLDGGSGSRRRGVLRDREAVVRALGQRRLDRDRRPQHRRLVEPDELHADRHPGRAGEPGNADGRHAEQRPRAAQQRVAGVALGAQRRLAERGGDERGRPSRPARPRDTWPRARRRRPLPLPGPPDRARCTRASPGRGRRGGRGTPARGYGRRHAPSSASCAAGSPANCGGSSSSRAPTRRAASSTSGASSHPRRAAERDPRLAGGGLEAREPRGVGDRAAERAERVEPGAEALDAGGRGPAVAGLEADDAAERRGPDHRAGGLGAVGDRHHPGRDRGGRPARRAAGRAVGVVRVDRRPAAGRSRTRC